MTVPAPLRYVLVLAVVCAAGVARADETHPVFIWYRSAGECPDGDAFIGQLKGRVADARIAGAGDPVDFVVTLGSLGKRANGRLERQTRDRTVAIREIDAEDCSEVAEAIALSLALAAVPSEAQSDVHAAPAPSASAPGSDETAASSASPTPSAPAPNPAHDAVRDGGTSGRARSNWSLGLAATLATGIAPAPLPGGSAFIELDGGRVLPKASARLGVIGMFGSVATDVGDVHYRLLASRFDACPWRLGGETLSAAPCMVVDAGALRVEGTGSTGRADTAFWAAVGAHARISWRASTLLSFEAQAGGFAPLTRYTLSSGDPPVDAFSTRPLGFLAAIGTAARLP